MDNSFTGSSLDEAVQVANLDIHSTVNFTQANPKTCAGYGLKEKLFEQVS